MAGFEIRSRKTLIEPAFFSVSENEVVTPDGDAVTRYTVHHPGAVVIAAVEGDRIALVRQYRVAADQELLELPAGKREPGEAPEVTAARELVEEVGLAPGRLIEVADFYNSPGFSDERTHVYLALDCAPAESGFEPKSEEKHMTLEWIALADISDRVAAGEFLDAKTIIGLIRARDRLLDSTAEGGSADER